MNSRYDEETQEEVQPTIERPPARIELDGNCYAILKEGIVRLYASTDAEIFSIDANTVPFEKKILGAVVQVYLLGLSRGGAAEKAKLENKLTSIITLMFDK